MLELIVMFILQCVFYQPSPLFAVRMRSGEFRLFAQQPYGQRERDNHHYHRNVERDQRAEYEKSPVIDDARSWMWHNVFFVYQT